ncbi:hypothetical protein TSOC_008620 [Tetrabaena socialis]|uniref:Uncharacterized protein n=1 Tax=Tetrabaena socialis TaxID=47790 RepID=A0A2J7ZY39_9CHLO|nr:hypothetical protein TSOC_008620 [Tetrabaena socialis]|eukprot:PNH05180.1 hypothetical protein TSOC_008620 [Tetrabaena socialis]
MAHQPASRKHNGPEVAGSAGAIATTGAPVPHGISPAAPKGPESSAAPKQLGVSAPHSHQRHAPAMRGEAGRRSGGGSRLHAPRVQHLLDLLRLALLLPRHQQRAHRLEWQRKADDPNHDSAPRRWKPRRVATHPCSGAALAYSPALASSPVIGADGAHKVLLRDVALFPGRAMGMVRRAHMVKGVL